MMTDCLLCITWHSVGLSLRTYMKTMERGRKHPQQCLSAAAESCSQVYFNKDRRLKDDSWILHVGKNSKYIKLSCTSRQNTSQSMQLSKESSRAHVGTFTGGKADLSLK